MYLLTHSVICYSYDPWLKNRLQTIDEWRLRPGHWTEEEQALYEAEEDANDLRGRKWGDPSYWEAALNRNRALETEKSLVEIDFDVVAVRDAIGQRFQHGRNLERGDRVCAVCFFHNDDDTADKLFDGNTPERRLELKQFYIECCLNVPYVKTVEIPYDFTLTEDYLRDLFMEHAVDKLDQEWRPVRV